MNWSQCVKISLRSTNEKFFEAGTDCRFPLKVRCQQNGTVSKNGTVERNDNAALHSGNLDEPACIQCVHFLVHQINLRLWQIYHNLCLNWWQRSAIMDFEKWMDCNRWECLWINYHRDTYRYVISFACLIYYRIMSFLWQSLCKYFVFGLFLSIKNIIILLWLAFEFNYCMCHIKSLSLSNKFPDILCKLWMIHYLRPYNYVKMILRKCTGTFIWHSNEKLNWHFMMIWCLLLK